MRKMFTLLLPLASLSLANAAADNVEPLPKSFAAKTVEAINSHIPEKIERLVHPQSITCLSGENHIMIDNQINRYKEYYIPKDYKMKIEAITQGYVPIWRGLFGDKFDYPVQPSHHMSISWQVTTPSRIISTSVEKDIVLYNDEWYEIFPCPKPGAMKWLEDKKTAAAAEKQKAHDTAQQVAAQLKEPLRATIISLTEQGQRIDAIKRLVTATGQNIGVASEVLDLLSPKIVYEALELTELQKLADHGSAGAQYHIGELYLIGKTVNQDYREALSWFQKAAIQGYVNAYLSIGGMYEAGNGVPKDYKEAAEWYLKAAEQESHQAQFYLGWFYEAGLGVPKDFVTAYMWYELSGVIASIDKLAVKMTPEQIAEGNKLASAWKPKLQGVFRK